MRRASESPGTRPPLRFGLRPRLLAALVLTAMITLGAAAVALLAPLQSRLNSDAVSLTKAVVAGARTPFSDINRSRGRPNLHALYGAAHGLDRNNKLVGVVVWARQQNSLRRLADTRPDKDAVLSQSLPLLALRHPGKQVTREANGVLAVAARYRSQGSVYVLEVFKPLDYVGEASGVVQSAFLEAAVVGLMVAIALGVGFSSRLLRRLRLLQDASRSLDERDLSTLVVPQDTVSDEIGELARGFATMHARLRQQEDARRAFVATASHELRTPLASLDGMLELLADDLDSEPIDIADARERVARAQQQSRRLASLASDLLDLSRLDALVDLRSEPVELGETARAVAAEFDSRARARDIGLVLSQAGGQAWAQADPGSVARIVRILLDNALRVAPAQTTIAIRLGGAGDEATIDVADEGPGVPDDERDLIFERFQRGNGRSDEGGFGLGLAIGAELASRMGGRLELTEMRPGATFRLRLPEVPS